MEIVLENLVPIPLKEKFSKRTSAVWNTKVLFSQGEKIQIQAPSGTGKTTLIHLIYKLRHDYEGQVLYDAKPLTEIKNGELADTRQKKISIIFQDLRLFENLTARENIELKRVLTAPIYDASVIDEMASRLGISHILHQKAGVCSYGEQQRIAIVRALVQPFNWLLMDEPFSHLDRENIEKAASLIAEECNKRQAGLLITDLEADTHFNYTKRYQL
ncbi:MAG: ATP-binding cassette domain-containing protein [Chitinophagaceae bacterium]|nr:ATP-binding cassette domain-containing protein [Chitinophagaceae bacterium]